MLHTLQNFWEKISVLACSLKVKTRNNIVGWFIKPDTLKCYNAAMITILQCWKSFWLVRQKKSSLVSGNRLVKMCLSSTRPHRSNVYENIYFFFQTKNSHTNKNFFTSKFMRMNLRFFPRALCFSTKASVVRVVF